MEQLRLLQAVFHLARARRELNSLKQTRAELQTEVRRLIDELSPEYDNVLCVCGGVCDGVCGEVC